MESPGQFEIPLTIGVISDTHIYHASRRGLPLQVMDLFQRFGVGLILHAGDINVLAVLAELRNLAPVLAVCGNNDEVQLQQQLPVSREILVGDTRIGLVHGHGGKSAREVAMSWFAGNCDLAVFGHSHQPLLEERQGTVFFNPGSPLDRRQSLHFGIGIIHVTEQGAKPELILFENPAQLDAVQP